MLSKVTRRIDDLWKSRAEHMARALENCCRTAYPASKEDFVGHGKC